MVRRSSRCRCALPAVVVLAAAAVGCSTTARLDLDSAELAAAVAALNRPSAGDIAALYDLRVARSGGMKLAVITDGDSGRMTISEPFGSAVSLTAWSAGSPTIFFDMDEGCRREVGDLEEVLGVGTLPLNQAVRLLGGRLPAMPGDDVEIGDHGEVEVHGLDWAVRLRLAANPWRVVELTELRSDGTGGWRIELSSHTSSVPGKIRLENADGRWVELELKRLEWPEEASLPELPDFPVCPGW
jgi:hypothetical protein